MAWWQQVYQYSRQLLDLTQKVDRHDADIEKMRQEIKGLTDAIQRLAYEVKLDRETEARDRENLALRIENQLLRFEHLLPPPPGHSSEKSNGRWHFHSARSLRGLSACLTSRRTDGYSGHRGSQGWAITNAP